MRLQPETGYAYSFPNAFAYGRASRERLLHLAGLPYDEPRRRRRRNWRHSHRCLLNNMFAVPTPQQLALLHDEELLHLATLWRAHAARGVCAAFGVAHALEVECRRRAREGRGPVLRAVQAEAPRRSWWKSWWARAVAVASALGAPVPVRSVQDRP